MSMWLSRPIMGLRRPHLLLEVLLHTKATARALLNKKFWGDEVVLYTVSCMWNLQITVFNSRTDEEYHICHNAIMDQADVNLVLNGGMHYSAGGKWSPVCC